MKANSNPNGNGSNPDELSLTLKGIETKLKTLIKQVKQLQIQNSPEQQLSLFEQTSLTELIQDLQNFKSLPEILKPLQHALTQIIDQLTQRSDLTPLLQQTLTTIETFETQIQNLSAQMTHLTDQQNQLTQLHKTHLNRSTLLSPIQMFLNGKQLSLKTFLLMFLGVTLLQTAIAVPILAMILSQQVTPTLNRINGRVNNLEINQKKMLNP